MNIRVSVLKLQLGAARLAPPRLVLEVGGTLGLGHLKDGEGRNYGMDTESLKFMFISKSVVSLYQGLNQVR